MKTNISLLNSEKRLAACLLFLLSGSAFGQPNSNQDVVELSPFQVDGSKDAGYAAQNTLAGSRMNTRLKDTPAPISVFTKEFLSDIGADNIEDMMTYSVNMTPELSQDDGDFGANQLTAFDARYRIRGLDADQARNYFTYNYDQDIFNMERVDESRGPNSILFGVGKAGGVINSSTKRPILGGDSLELNLTVGDADRYRAHVDYNKVLIEGKLGLRFNTLYNEYGENGRPWVYGRDERHHLALIYKPSESTTLNVEYEYGDIVKAPTQPFGPGDGARLWIEQGRQLNGTGVGAAQGVSGVYGNDAITYIDDSGVAVNLKGQSQTTSAPGWTDNHFTYENNVIDDPAKGGVLVVPVDASLSGPMHMRSFRDARLASASLEHRFGENTFIEIAASDYEYDRLSYRIGGQQNLLGDPNATLPDGTPNPYAGELYFDARIQRDLRLFTHEFWRITASHNFETDSWLGDHRVAALYQSGESTFERFAYTNVWLGAPTPFGVPFNATPENARNQVFYRNYVTHPEDKKDWRVGFDPNMTGEGLAYTLPTGSKLYNGVVTTAPTTLTSGWAQDQAKDELTQLDSKMIAGQSKLLGDRMFLTYGLREDDFSFNSPLHIRNPITNQRTDLDYTSALTNEFTAQTRSVGAVYHVNDWMSVVANQGTNSGISDFSDKLILGPPGERGALSPVPEGESKDIALTFDLLNGGLFIKAGYFETTSNNNTAFLSWRDFSVIVGIRDLYGIAMDAGFIDAATVDAQMPDDGVGTFSNLSDGYELTAIGNLSENWRVSLNYSYTNSLLKETFSEFLPWWEGPTGKSFFQKFDAAYMDPDRTRGAWEDGLNYGQAIAAVENAGMLQLATAGSPSTGQHHHKANVFTNYSFTEGRLKGFRIGGGAKYVSGGVWNQANPALGLQEFGGLTTFDAVFGWRKRFDRYTLDLQLNIKNLFDNDNLQIARLDDDLSPDGGYEVYKYILTPARDMRLRASFRF